MNIGKFLILVFSVTLIAACNPNEEPGKHSHQATLGSTMTLMSQSQDTMATNNNGKIEKTEKEWKELLTSKEFRILRNGGTEMPFVNEYWNNKKEGIYYCAACGQPLYSSEHKYKSGTGWPSFWQPVDPSAVEEREDNSLFMTRTEIICSRCESHIGHVFNDGPDPTGLRYCMNSAALDFEERKAD